MPKRASVVHAVPQRAFRSALAFTLACSMVPSGAAFAVDDDVTTSSEEVLLEASSAENGPESETTAEEGALLAAASEGSAIAEVASVDESATSTLAEGAASGFGLTYVTGSTATTWDGATIDVSWYGDGSATVYHIKSAAQLIGLSAITSPLRGTFASDVPTATDGSPAYSQVNSNAVDAAGTPIKVDLFDGKTVYLDSDIDLAGGTASSSTCDWWKPIADLNVYSASAGGQGASVSGSFGELGWHGTFDGRGHTISNLYVDGTANPLVSTNYGGYQGLFSSIGLGGVIRNVGTSGYVKGRLCGGICSVSTSLDLENLPANADMVWPRIENCWSSCTNVNNGSSSRMSGGIFGGEDGYRISVNVINCYSSANLSGGQSRGGIVGSANGVVAGCYFFGAIQSAGSNYCGAIAASLYLSGAEVDGVAGAGRGAFVNCFAQTGSNSASGDLYRYYDATHDKPVEVGGFVSEAVLKASASKLGSAYVADTEGVNGGYPILWCQAGLSEIDMSSATVAPIEDVTYTGAANKPIPTLTLDGSKLVYGTDYLVAYENNVSAGVATVHIYGVGRYVGQAQDVTFNILATGLENATVHSYTDTYWRYPGDEDSAVVPNLYVTDADGNRLKEGTDYVIQCENNDRAGTATATLLPAEGSGVSGSKSLTFSIVDASASLQGAGTAEDPYLVSSVYDLQLASHKIQQADAAYAGGCYKLTRDVDATPKAGEPELSPLGVSYFSGDTYGLVDAPFYGSFDGDGHTITLGMTSSSYDNFKLKWWSSADGLTCSSPYNSTDLALFGCVKAPSGQEGKRVEIKNLTIDGSVEATQVSKYMSAFVAYAYNVDLVMTNCTNDATLYAGIKTAANGYEVTTNTTPTGGLVGYMTGGTLTNCVNNGTVAGEAPKYGKLSGVVCEWSALNDLTITGCLNTADLVSGSTAAGIVQTGSGSAASALTVERCGNTGSVTAAGSGAAGIVHSTITKVGSGMTVSGCFNTGDITLTSGGFTGGIVSKTPQKGSTSISDCYNTGDVRNTSTVLTGSANTCAGGILGGIPSAGVTNCPYTVTVDNCYNTGERSAAYSTAVERVGSIIGSCNASAYAATKNPTVTVTRCYYQDGVGVGPIQTTNATAGMTVSDGSTQVSAEDMRADAFLATLGEAFKADSAGEASYNFGYPVLAWQQAPEAPEVLSASLAVSASEAKLGEVVTVEVSLDKLAPAMTGSLVWDDESLQLVSIAAGEGLVLPEGTAGFEGSADDGTFAFYGNTADSENAVVVVATFRCVKMGTGSVGLGDCFVGKTVATAKTPVTCGEGQSVTAVLPGTLGDINNNGRVNIVDAQVVYDYSIGKYGQSGEALLKHWGEDAFTAMIDAVSDVNTDGAVDAGDSFAIQYAVHHGWGN